MENAIRFGGGAFKKEREGMRRLVEELRDFFSHVLRVCAFSLFLVFCYPMF